MKQRDTRPTYIMRSPREVVAFRLVPPTTVSPVHKTSTLISMSTKVYCFQKKVEGCIIHEDIIS